MAGTETIKSIRLCLRPLGIDDISPAYISWLNNPVINQYLEIAHNKHDYASVKDFIEYINAKNDEFLFGIFLNGPGKHIGNIKIGPIKPYHKLADVSFFIGEQEEWGKGYASEAIKIIMDYSFNKLKVNKLSASLYAPNIGSAKALEKAGFKKEGYRMKHYFLNGRAEDIVEYGAYCENNQS